MPSPLATQGSTAGSSSAPGTPSGEPQRRPTKERLRVSRACDECKKKKIRCTGQNPCQRCSRDGVACHYDAPYLRGKRKSNREKLNGTSVTPPSSTSPFNRDTITGPQHRSDRRPPSPRDDDEGGLPQESIRVAGGTPARRPPAPGNSSRASPAPGESDRQGHFVGASSGLSFLLRLQRRLRRDARDAAAAESPVFTLRDTVLPEFDELAFTLPRREEANALLTTYFELSSPTYRFLHRPTIEFWLQQLYDTGVIAGPNFHSKYAVILTMFAQATRYTGAASNSPDANTGLQYFQAAERQLSRETEPATLTSVQALLGCCFYILTRSRLNHCWNLFGTTSRLILALGMHRRKEKFEGGAPSACGVDLVELECRKRVFWCAYNLDKYLSAIFGRPCAFHDDDIDQDMPSLVEDADLAADSLLVSGQENMNTMLGPINHQRLGQILSRTLRRLYGIRPLDRATRYRIMSELGAEVDAWRAALPAFLNPDRVDSRILLPLFQRQSNLLSLASGHVEILIYRPCLFDDFRRGPPRETAETGANVRRCLAAALSIAGVIDRMVAARQFYAASWFSHYQAFCAVVVLYTYTLRSRHDEGDAETWRGAFRAAERCQGLIASVATVDSLAHRFFVIMEEFRLEVVRLLRHDDAPSPLDVDDDPGLTARGEAAAGVHTALPPPDLVTAELRDPSSWLADAHPAGTMMPFTDLPDWEQLDSLALDIGTVFPDLGLMGSHFHTET